MPLDAGAGSGARSDPLFDGDAGGERGGVEGDGVVVVAARDFDAGLFFDFDEIEELVGGGAAEGGGDWDPVWPLDYVIIPVR